MEYHPRVVEQKYFLSANNIRFFNPLCYPDSRLKNSDKRSRPNDILIKWTKPGSRAIDCPGNHEIRKYCQVYYLPCSF